VQVYFVVTFFGPLQARDSILQHMVYVETIDLASRGVVLPNDRVGMVIAQPYLSLTATEPYRCAPAAQAAQLACLDATLAVSRSASHGAGKTHFTVFPEYSIPGLDGVARISDAMQSAEWPTGTVVIGGTDGLSHDDFTTLAEQPNTHRNGTADDLTRITANEWVNCGITWVKRVDGVVERWLQPKLHPAWPEQAIQYQAMFQGQSVFTFKGQLENGSPYRFSTLVCFDWIATVANQKSWRWVVDHLRQQAQQADAELSLSWLFVIQHNRSPSHDTFLAEVAAFFDQTVVPTVRRERACLVLANTAGQSRPGRVDGFGGTSLVFTTQTLFSQSPCQPTFSNGGRRFRSSTLLNAYLDVFFRERGACIHSFVQVNPNSLNAGAAGRTIAVERAFVYPLNSIADPRTPSGPVPACVKWLNDELDTLPSLGDRYPDVVLAGTVQTAHNTTIGYLRVLQAQSAEHAVQLATCRAQKRDADDWDQTEAAALEHLVHTLDIFGMGCLTTIGTDPSHAIVTLNGQKIDLIAIRGDTHEVCIEHSKDFLPSLRRVVLLVSRDHDNTPWLRRFGSILEPEPARINDERKITEPQARSLHLGYFRLLDIFQSKATSTAVQEAIYAELVA
jgi:hypothetical protein